MPHLWSLSDVLTPSGQTTALCPDTSSLFNTPSELLYPLSLSFPKHTRRLRVSHHSGKKLSCILQDP